jgi:hypothetical protein
MWVFSKAGSFVRVVRDKYFTCHYGCGRFTLFDMCAFDLRISLDWFCVCHTSRTLLGKWNSFFPARRPTHTCIYRRAVFCEVELVTRSTRGYLESNLIGLHHAALTIAQSKFIPFDSVFFVLLSWSGRSLLVLSLKVSQTTTTMINGQWNYARINYTTRLVCAQLRNVSWLLVYDAKNIVRMENCGYFYFCSKCLQNDHLLAEMCSYF